ncbi:sulfatase-like hydrolase/transferase, partial [Akkermansiaceae bacterium]|nr:sulfatase-like hydrolase/transferase [Akkermansiaceae bacterium]MDB4546347.1 sulfatase-like hydrolase/transferase [Akkermansiaceae bacterium]
MRSLILLSFLFTASLSAKKPNFLFIIVDDQSPFDLKVYDPKSALETPNIDRLAREGLVFDGSYHMGSWKGAVCTCSRHMIMTGRTVWHLPGFKTKDKGANVGQLKLVPPNLEKNSLPAVFNRAGYDTMRTCKKGNSYAGANKEFQIVKDATKRGGDKKSGSHWHG